MASPLQNMSQGQCNLLGQCYLSKVQLAVTALHKIPNTHSRRQSQAGMSLGYFQHFLGRSFLMLFCDFRLRSGKVVSTENFGLHQWLSLLGVAPCQGTKITAVSL